MTGAALATRDNESEGFRPPDIRLMRSRGTENHARLYDLTIKARDAGKTLSALLEDLDPTLEYGSSALGLDAFDRVMMAAGIRSHSDEMRGIWASQLGDFAKTKDDTNGAALCNEWINRVWRTAKYGGRRRDYAAQDQHQRLTFGSDDAAIGSVYRPYIEAAGLRSRQIAPSVPISELVAVSATIDQNTYRAAYLAEPSVSQLRMVRIPEGAEIPRTRIATRQQVVYLQKYGRAIESTYEALRRVPIDLVAILLARIAIQADEDKVGTITDVIINGDGNANTSALNVNLTALDPATTANNMTLTSWLAYLLKFSGPYRLTTVLTQEASALKLLTVNAGTANPFMSQVTSDFGMGAITPMNPAFAGAVRLGTTTWAPANKLVGFDSRFTVQRLLEAGADISETQRWILNQTEVLTVTEVEGYAIMDANGAWVLNLAA
jgi:hypothetical protein